MGLFKWCKKTKTDSTLDFLNLASYLEIDINVFLMRSIAFIIWCFFMKRMTEYLKSLPTEHMHRT